MLTALTRLCRNKRILQGTLAPKAQAGTATETFEFENAEPTVFVGYDTLETDAKVVGIVVEDEGVCDTIIENQRDLSLQTKLLSMLKWVVR